MRVVPQLGRKALSLLTALDLQALYTDLARSGLLLSRNPCDGTTPPRPKRAEMRILTQVQVATLFSVIRDHPAHALDVLAVTTGMRQGELFGLKWDDIDLDASRLMVRGALQRQNEAGLVFIEPKTARSRRTILLSQRVIAALREHRRRQLEDRLLLASEWHDLNLVFCGVDGRTPDPGWQRQVFQQVLRANDLPVVRFHYLRHTAATMLFAQNVHPKVVSEMFGHATISLTLDTYSHLVPALHAQAAAAMDAMLGA